MSYVTLDIIKNTCARFNYYQQFIDWGLKENFLTNNFPVESLRVAVIAQYDGNHWWVIENSNTFSTLLVSHHGEQTARDMLSFISSHFHHASSF